MEPGGHQRKKEGQEIVPVAKVLGIIAFSFSILLTCLAIIPCVGMYMLFPLIFSLMISIGATVVFVYFEQPGKGMYIAGIIISVVGIIISIVQWSLLAGASAFVDQGLHNL